ncbi:MAG: DUF2283 domain-containing protein [bacterium]|nr:DUF2283 domain-containing protein [bacterium]
MRIEYDPKVDAAYIYLMDDIGVGGVAFTVPCDPVAVDGEINLDFDDQRRLIGIEIMSASRKLPPGLLGAIEQDRDP